MNIILSFRGVLLYYILISQLHKMVVCFSCLPLEIMPLVCEWLAQKDVVHLYYAIRYSCVLSGFAPYKRFPVFISGGIHWTMRVDVQKKSGLFSTLMSNDDKLQSTLSNDGNVETATKAPNGNDRSKPSENRRMYVLNRIVALRTECRKCTPPVKPMLLKGFIAGSGSERERRFSVRHTQRTPP